jgi:hypothetical protein
MKIWPTGPHVTTIRVVIAFNPAVDAESFSINPCLGSRRKPLAYEIDEEDDNTSEEQAEVKPADPRSIISIAPKGSLPGEMAEFLFVWQPVKFFAPRPYAGDGFEGAAFRNGKGDYFEVRTYPDAPRGSSRVFTSLKSDTSEERNEVFSSVLYFLSQTGMRNINGMSLYDGDKPYRTRRDDFDSLVALETLYDLILREAWRALPGVVSKNEIQAIIEAEWAFPKGDLEQDDREKTARWLSSYEMLFTMFPSGFHRRTISFDGARRITLREKGLEYLRQRAFIA